MRLSNEKQIQFTNHGVLPNHNLFLDTFRTGRRGDMDETLCKFVLNLVVLLIIGIFVIKVPLKNIKSFDIDFKLSNGFKLNAKFYEKKNKNNK